MFQPAPLPAPIQAIIFATSSGIQPTGGIDLIIDASVGGPVSDGFSISPTSGLADENLDGAFCGGGWRRAKIGHGSLWRAPRARSRAGLRWAPPPPSSSCCAAASFS